MPKEKRKGLVARIFCCGKSEEADNSSKKSSQKEEDNKPKEGEKNKPDSDETSSECLPPDCYKSLQDEIDAFAEKICQQESPKVIQFMQESTRDLAESGITENAVQKPAPAPAFELPDANGSLVKSKDLFFKENGGATTIILTFYRGAWCPYCNMQLKAYQAYFEQFQQAGASDLVAISPNLPKYTQQAVETNQLQFTVLSDVENVVAKRYGLVYSLPQRLRPIYELWGFDIPTQNGDDSYEIPLAATYIIQDGIIQYSHINADYAKRAEPTELLRVLKELQKKEK